MVGWAMTEAKNGGRRGGAPTPGATWARRRDRSGRLATACAAVGMLAAIATPGVAGATTVTANSSDVAGAAATTTAGSYIVQAGAGRLAAAEADAVALGGRIGAELQIVNGFSVRLPGGAAAALARSADVGEVSPDVGGSVQGSTYNPYTDAGSTAGLSNDVGYTAYWNQRLSGQGIGIALIDSGVAPVSALAAPGKLSYGPDFTPTGYFSAVRGLDTFGHGTFMAGLIAGRDPGATAPYQANSGHFLGVAPDAHIVSVKVADDAGYTTESAVIAAIQWVVQHRNDPGLNIKVLNLSLGIRDNLSYTHDPLDAAAEAAWKSGITVVAAAGNDGKHGMTAPADDPYVIAVGAVDSGSSSSVSDDLVAGFSNVGDGVRNPDFGTLGTHVVSLRVPGSAVDRQYGGGSAVSSSLMRGSGTSEAAAITSGAAALLIGQRPGITPDQVKSTMAVHSTWLPNLSGTNLGAGELNMNWTLNAATEYRTQSWPSAYGAPATVSSVQSARAANSPSGATWTGATWTAHSWAGATWTGATWTGSTWTSRSWAGATWTGATWTGSTWTGSTWTDAAWTTESWN